MGRCSNLSECLNEQEADNLPPGWAYVLPTEARGICLPCRHHHGLFWGDDINASLANYDSNVGQTSSNVGSYGANPWGIFDLHGNVWEWCVDLDGPYEVGPLTDPVGSTSGINRVKRGGSWITEPLPYGLQCVRLEAPSNKKCNSWIPSFLPSNYKSPNQPQYCLITEYRGEPTGRLFIGTFTATDVDPNPTLSYYLINGAGDTDNSLS